MKKIVVVSDSHGNRQALDGLCAVIAEADAVFHLGDTSSDGAYLRAKFPGKCTVINGNCDFMKVGEDEAVMSFEGVKIFACHGHAYGVKQTPYRLAARAEELGCAVALYGHTHRADESRIGGVTLINPGSLTRYGRKSYAYLVITGDKCVCKIVSPDE